MTRIVSKDRTGRAWLGLHICWARVLKQGAVLTLALLNTAGAAHADDTCGLGEVRLDFRHLAPASWTSREWVQSQVIDGGLDQPRTTGIDGTIATIAFSYHRESTSMEAPRDFTFRSGWMLNTQFAFRKGDKFSIRARYDVPSGSTYYALMPPGERHLTIFARPDGTLCNKVMNTNAGDHGFLVRQYKSSPATKLTMQRDSAQGEPLVLKVVYLGSSGGIASLREVWSRGGRILDVVTHTFDPGARELQIGPINLLQVSMTPASATARLAAPPGQLPVNRYWQGKIDR
jgi:hypothetical protein